MTLTPEEVTIIPSAWDAPVSFLVGTINDEVQVAESYTSTISHTASSGDALFDGNAPAFFPSSQVRSKTSGCTQLLSRFAASYLILRWGHNCNSA